MPALLRECSFPRLARQWPLALPIQRELRGKARIMPYNYRVGRCQPASLGLKESNMEKRQARCQNFNHGRSNAPVRFCPMCGEVVNQLMIHRKTCGEQVHARRRQNRDVYCVDCGLQIIHRT